MCNSQEYTCTCTIMYLSDANFIVSKASLMRQKPYDGFIVRGEWLIYCYVLVQLLEVLVKYMLSETFEMGHFIGLY